MKKILIIDDDESILESLQFLFEDEGYSVTTAPDGRVISDVMDGKLPDVILLDYWLPNENGGEITQKLKKHEHTKKVPVIIMSASYNIKDTVRSVGADDFIPKPYDINTLLSKIEMFTS